MPKEFVSEENKRRMIKPEAQETTQPRATSDAELGTLIVLQQTVGNQAVQRLLAQRSGDGPFELDDETASRINSARSSGQSLDTGLQQQMGSALGQDLSSVRVHTSSEADTLNRQLNAQAFTTGRDIFFRDGAYDPHSTGGQELISHELTHVVQQSTGAVSGSSGKMTVNAPGDTFEQEADAVAKAVMSAGPTANAEAGIQRQALPEEDEEELAQRQLNEEEEEEELP